MISFPIAVPIVLHSGTVADLPGRTRGTGKAPLRVGEWTYRYEDEGSERRSLGSVSAEAGAWWSVALSVPGGERESGDDALLVRFERHGVVPAGYRGGVDAELLLPRSEIDAIVMLLAGVVDQARRDGVLPAGRPERSESR